MVDNSIRTRFTRLLPDLAGSEHDLRYFKDKLVKVLLGLIMLVIITPFFLVLFQVAGTGLVQLFGTGPGQGLDFLFTFPGVGLEGGIRNAFVGTVELVVLASSVGVPLSVFGAVFISEYTRPGLIKELIEFASDVLAGIPSIVFGAFGFAFLVDFLHMGMGLVAGALTLAFMMIPTVLRTTQEALRSVPMSLREASLALGATKWSTTWNVTMRAAFPGMITGVLLAVGRIMGETAPLIFTAGNSLSVPTELVGSGSWVASMPYTIWAYISDPRNYLQEKAQGVALTLMIMVLAIDVIANLISRKVTRRLV
ncbi:MAG: phosphate ABC transporter permease PtsA [Candidatus Thorarchaeota archaeon]|nr:MAG: phosphate ABC transporter permease PtsA [Candidatus Thorarchaeota archaeon]